MNTTLETENTRMLCDVISMIYAELWNKNPGLMIGPSLGFECEKLSAYDQIKLFDNCCDYVDISIKIK